MSDPIRPPLAARPDELCRLIADALGDGDLEAALSYYEDAIVHESNRGPQAGITALRVALTRVVDSRLSLHMQPDHLLTGPDLAMMSGRWRLSGRNAAHTPVNSRGTFFSTARLQASGGWRLALEHLTIDDEGIPPWDQSWTVPS